MKFISLLLLPIALFPSYGRAQTEKILNLQDGRKLYTITSFTRSTNTNPTLILLPGIFRGYFKDEEFLTRLTDKKINWVTLHFSRHPRSVLAGSAIWTKPVSSEDLAQEVLAVKQFYKLKKPIVVSLSFSASVIPALDPAEFPVAIETAPMGRHNENTPPNPYYQNWQQWTSMFPVWGPWVVQNAEYWAYRSYWIKEVDQLSETYPEYKAERYKIAEGLAQLASSSKEFDLRNQDFVNGPDRFWILGQNEDRTRAHIQQQAILQHARTNPRGRRVYVIQGAGHIVRMEQPGRYAYTLENIVKSVAQ